MARYQSGTLADSSPFIVNVGAELAPMTATLTSAASNRLIRLSSTAAAGSYYSAIYDASNSTMVNVAINAPLRAIEFTGQAGDVWEIR